MALVVLAIAPPARALDLGLKDKTVLVTGSTSNIGYATARLFLKEGATVIINSHQQASIDEALVKLEKETGRRPLAFLADVTNPADIAKLVAAHPRVDVLVNNVGGMIPAEFLASTDKQLGRQLAAQRDVRRALWRATTCPACASATGAASSSSRARAGCRSRPKASPTAR